MNQRLAAVTECLLVAPAALFMAALWLRFIAAPQHVGFVEALIAWYAGRSWALWLLLVGLPLAALAGGAAVLWPQLAQIRANAAALVVGAASARQRSAPPACWR